jgi:hypothetical protein
MEAWHQDRLADWPSVVPWLWFDVETYHYHYAIVSYHSNELSTFNTLYVCKLRSKSRMSEQYFKYIVFVLWILVILWCGYVNCSVPYKGDSLWLNICSCYSWQMMFTSSSTCQSITCRTGKDYGRKQGKAYTTNEEASCWILGECYTVKLNEIVILYLSNRL